MISPDPSNTPAPNSGHPHSGHPHSGHPNPPSLPGESLRGAPPALVALLLNAIGEGVALVDRAGRILWANDPIRTQPGAMLERIAGSCRQFDRHHPALPPGYTPPPGDTPPREGSVLVDGARAFDLTIAPADGPLLTALGPSLDGARDCLVVTLRDATAERSLQQKIAAIDMAGSELVRVDPDVVRKLNAHERLKLLESKIIRFAKDLLHFDHFAIRLLNDDNGKLELVIGHNLPPEFDSFTIKPALEGFGISGHVAATGRSYLCSDITNDHLYLPGVVGARSSLTVPLKLHEKVIGIMNVESTRENGFSDDDRRLGEIFARYIAIAIHTLDLLVIERCTTNQTITGRVAIELHEPLQDIAHELDLIAQRASAVPSVGPHVDRIRADLDAIRARLKECAAGPQTLLGVERALAESTLDPLLEDKRVLVVDDAPQVRRIITDVLKKRGCDIVTCEDGRQALQAFKDAEPAGFHLVISDIRLPDHNGYEIFAAARATEMRPAVILMTGFGYDPHHSIVRASQEGLQCVLFKPFQVERLLDEVRKALSANAATT